MVCIRIPKTQQAKIIDMGKSCIRFKKPNEISYTLIGELMKKNECSGMDKYLRK